MPVDPQISSSPRSSRAKQQPKTRSKGTKYVQRIVFTLLVALLVVALGYLLFPWAPDVHFAVLPVTDNNRLAVPPIPYSREGANSLKELQTRPAVIDLDKEIQTSDAFDTLASKLKEGLKGADTLIVYLTCNCISDVAEDGPAAWLLCSDFAVRSGQSDLESRPVGRYRLRDVLRQMKECKAKSKLLILDSGYLNYDPRLGVFVNEFPGLLEKEVHAINDPDLWVLCSCQPLETSHVCGAQKRSVFDYFVTDAFTGAANRNNRWIELEDVYNYVREGVSGWVDHQSGSAETQIPWIVHCDGVESPPKALRLVPVLNRKTPQHEAEADNSPGGAAPTGKPSPAADLAARIDEIWQLRDRLQGRDSNKAGGGSIPWTMPRIGGGSIRNGPRESTVAAAPAPRSTPRR